MANLFSSKDGLGLVSMIDRHGDNKTEGAGGDDDDDLFDDYMLALQLQMQNENCYIVAGDDGDEASSSSSSSPPYLSDNSTVDYSSQFKSKSSKFETIDSDDDEDLKIVSFNGNNQTKKHGAWSDGGASAGKQEILVDPEFDLIDPCPDIRALFQEFDKKYFWNRLGSCLVEWSKRMTICAGIFYLREGGIIRLSEPLLKYRPRKDLVETLLHEMIHAYLYLTRNFKDHGEHGDEFKGHMNRINKLAGTHITVYHSFHDEVNHARQHVWRCTGPCRTHPPFYGYVKRSMNRAPGKNDTWWSSHQQKCNGQFEKIAEPESYKKKSEKKDKSTLEETKLNKTKSKDSSVIKKRPAGIDDSTLNSTKIDSFFSKKPKTPSPTKSSSSDDEIVEKKHQPQPSQAPPARPKNISSITIVKKQPQTSSETKIDVNQKRLEFFYSKSQLEKNSYLTPLDSKSIISSSDLSTKTSTYTRSSSSQPTQLKAETKRPHLIEITPADDITVLSNNSIEMIDETKAHGSSIVEWVDDDDIKLINEKQIECPVCAKLVDESNINVHVNQHFS